MQGLLLVLLKNHCTNIPVPCTFLNFQYILATKILVLCTNSQATEWRNLCSLKN
jgi:hypothetical protein